MDVQSHLLTSAQTQTQTLTQTAANTTMSDVDNSDDEPLVESIASWEKANPFDGPNHKPVPIKSASNDATAKVDFHDLCQKANLRPEFNIVEVAPFRFSGKVTFGSEVVPLAGPFASKSEARDVLCRVALPRAKEIEQACAKKKREDIEAAKAPPPRLYSEEELAAEDWISVLNNYKQKHLPALAYEQIRTENTPFHYACTVRFSGSPLQPFGSTDDLYPDKSSAKKSASREAVLWLRSQNKLSDGGPSLKRQKQPVTASTLPDTHGSDLAQLIGTLDLNQTEAASLPQRVNQTVASMGLMQPEFIARHESLTPDALVSMTVRFNSRDIQREPRLAHPIGVQNVFGKKKAKEACCREILRLLDELRRSPSGPSVPSMASSESSDRA